MQFGHYANFVGTHWWNIQESGFEYQSTQPSEIDHDVLFREGKTVKGQTTYTPRLLLVDLKGSLKALPQEGDLYDTPSDPHKLHVDWDHRLELRKEPTEPKNEFQSDLVDPAVLPEVSHKTYNPEENFKVWSDFLYSRFHPRTTNIIKEYEHCNEQTPFDIFTQGLNLWKTDFFKEDFSDKIRNYIEECDHFQGFHILADCTNGFSGISSACMEHLRDEYDRKSILVLPTIPSYFPDNDFETDREQVHSIMSDSTRVLNLALSFNSCRQLANMFVPLCTGSNGWRQPGTPKNFYHTRYNHKLPYHSSAIIAAALDTISLKYRIKSSEFSLMDLCIDLTGNGRKAAAGSVCLPFSFNSDADFIDCLDQWDGPLHQSITPRSAIGTNRAMQHLTIRGIPETRLKKPPNKAGNQKDMPAYKCNTVKEMMEYYLSCTTYASASNVTSVEKPLPVKTPFPDIFDEVIGQNGNIYAQPRQKNTRVETVPVLAGFHSGTEIGLMLESLHTEARKLKIARFHQFTIEHDEYEECLDDMFSLRENYEDSYLI